MRLIDADEVYVGMLAQRKSLVPPFDNYAMGYADAIKMVTNAPTVDAVVLPYHPRPMLKDRNPFNTDVYCPECGTNLSGYYGDDPLPIVTCFNCGEILDPYKATTKTDGERSNK